MVTVVNSAIQKPIPQKYRKWFKFKIFFAEKMFQDDRAGTIKAVKHLRASNLQENIFVATPMPVLEAACADKRAFKTNSCIF